MPFATDIAWPEGLIAQFSASEGDGIYENRWYGPYDTLLRYCFDYSYHYVVAAQAPPLRTSRESADFITYLVVTNQSRKPVLVLEIKDSDWRDRASRRWEADEQIRRRLGTLYEACPNPVLFGISAMGTHIRIYRLDCSSAEIEPQVVPLPASVYVAPSNYLRGQWDCDLLLPEGMAAMKSLIGEIKGYAGH